MSRLKDSTTHFWTGIHQSIFRASNGRILGDIWGMPVVMLTTTGRKTGKQRTTMLTSPVQDGDNIVIVASYGGDDRHPTWYLNLRDHPDVEVTAMGKNQRMRGRTASPEERAKLWPHTMIPTASTTNCQAAGSRMTRGISRFVRSW